MNMFGLVKESTMEKAIAFAERRKDHEYGPRILGLERAARVNAEQLTEMVNRLKATISQLKSENEREVSRLTALVADNAADAEKWRNRLKRERETSAKRRKSNPPAKKVGTKTKHKAKKEVK